MKDFCRFKGMRVAYGCALNGTEDLDCPDGPHRVVYITCEAPGDMPGYRINSHVYNLLHQMLNSPFHRCNEQTICLFKLDDAINHTFSSDQYTSFVVAIARYAGEKKLTVGIFHPESGNYDLITEGAPGINLGKQMTPEGHILDPLSKEELLARN